MAGPMKLLIAYDGSSDAENALEDLQRAGLPDSVEAVVLSVADVVVAPPKEMAPLPAGYSSPQAIQRAWAMIEQQIADAKAHAQEGAQRLQALFPAWTIRAETANGSPGWIIVSKANEWKTDLIVVGPHGKSVWDRLILGSVSRTVVTNASCTVRVARKREVASDRPLRILVGVDGSSAAAATVQAVAQRAWPAGTEIRLFTAVDMMLLTAMAHAPLPVESGSYGAGEDEMARVRHMVESTAEPLRQQNPQLVVSTQVERGDPKRLLVEEAEEWEADAIFVGAHGLGAWQRLWLGSVSAAVAAHAHCTVEVVRSSAS